MEEGHPLAYSPVSYPVASAHAVVSGRPTADTPSAPKETALPREHGPMAALEGEPGKGQLLPEPRPVRGRLLRTRRLHFTRRALALSVVAVAVVAIVAFAFLRGPLVLPGVFSTTQTQTLPETATTQSTGGALQIQINIVKNPISEGSVQTMNVTVRDPSGHAVSDASVHIEVVYPSGFTHTSKGLTDANGQYVHSLFIGPGNIGTFQVRASATKAGYETAQAQAAFEVTAIPP